MFYRIILPAVLVILSLGLAPLKADDNAPKITLKSHDEKVQLVVPDGWTKIDSSNPAAVIEARNEDKNAFIMVMITPRNDPYASLDDHAQALRDEILSHLVEATASDPQQIQVKGTNAVQYELHGVIAQSKVHFGYFLTVMQVNDHYLEVLSWSVEPHFNENVTILKQAANNVTDSTDK